MAGIEQQDVQGLGLGHIIAAHPAARRAWATARPSSFGRCCLASGGLARPSSDRVRGAGGKSSLTIPDKLLLWMQLFNEK